MLDPAFTGITEELRFCFYESRLCIQKQRQDFALGYIHGIEIGRVAQRQLTVMSCLVCKQQLKISLLHWHKNK